MSDIKYAYPLILNKVASPQYVDAHPPARAADRLAQRGGGLPRDGDRRRCRLREDDAPLAVGARDRLPLLLVQARPQRSRLDAAHQLHRGVHRQAASGLRSPRALDAPADGRSRLVAPRRGGLSPGRDARAADRALHLHHRRLAVRQRGHRGARALEPDPPGCPGHLPVRVRLARQAEAPVRPLQDPRRLRRAAHRCAALHRAGDRRALP